jgi:hypothetical protein
MNTYETHMAMHTCHEDCRNPICLGVREAVAAEREKVAAWMMKCGYATGHGETTEYLLGELAWQIVDNWTRAMIRGVVTEREECAKVCDKLGDEFADANPADCAEAIRARSQ